MYLGPLEPMLRICNGKPDCERCIALRSTIHCSNLAGEALAVRRQHQLDMTVVDSYRHRLNKQEHRADVWRTATAAVAAILVLSWLILAAAVIRVNGLARISKLDFEARIECYKKLKQCECPPPSPVPDPTH